jgi:hypothetical protein
MNKGGLYRCGNRGIVIGFLGVSIAFTVAVGTAWGQATVEDSSKQKSSSPMDLHGPGGIRWIVKGPRPMQILSGTPEEKASIQFRVRDVPVAFLADTIARETATDIIMATGNVTIKSGTSTVECHTMIYKPDDQKGRLGGEPGVPRGVRLIQKTGTGDRNYFETDWMVVTFGEGGIKEIETGPGAGEIMLTGEEPLPIDTVEPATGEASKTSAESLPRSIAPPPIDE